MTLAEINRAVKSKIRVEEMNAKRQANFDYLLADLIGVSIGRMFGDGIEYPKIEDVYTTLFTEEKKQNNKEKAEQEKLLAERKGVVSAHRFMEFAKSHNRKYKGGNSE